MGQIKLPISAIIVGYNEEHLIKDCLSSIMFCDEILFFDLGSSDNTLAVAKEMGVTTCTHERVPFAEFIHYEVREETKHDWILVIDPDEQVSEGLQQDIKLLFQEGIPEQYGAIVVPWIFYFKNKRLLGTPWGGINTKNILLNRRKSEFRQLVHQSRNVKEPYTTLNLNFKGDNFLCHYWMQSYQTLFEKHLRYIKHEPESRYKTGNRTTFKGILKTPFKAFKNSFWDTKGYKNRCTGLFLSFFWSWYETLSTIGLYRYQRKQNKK